MENIQTMISPIRSIWDRDDQWLPPGNYFFTVKKLKSKYVLGTVTHEQGFKSDFEFKINEFIQMMATSQASLARKANFSHDDMPNYPSPPSSPRQHRPNNFVEKEYEEQTCAICFEKVKKESDINYCLKALNCKHQFHRRCIIPWIRTNDTCPVCRKKKKTRRSSGNEEEEEELFPRQPTLSERLGFGRSSYYSRDELIDIIRGRRSGRNVRSNYVIQSETQL
tara:strand:- start:1184 stop:1852 length:669 start_codon:yes stop_codon:yes gene_type:complete